MGRPSQQASKGRISRKKIVDRITYDPNKHKQRKTREWRQKLQRQSIVTPPSPPKPSSRIKFGSLNVNGLDTESTWAVEQLLRKREFDVSFHSVY